MAETVGILLLEALFVGEFAGLAILPGLSLATLVGGAALIGAGLAVAYLMSPDLPKPSDGIQTMKQPMPPRPFGYGRARLGGAYMLYEARFVSDSNYNYSYDVIAFHNGLIGGFKLWYLNDDLVQLTDEDGGGPTGILTPKGNDGRYSSTNYNGATDLLYIDSRIGLATETAYVTVADQMPELWTSAHRGDGIASALMRCGPTTFDNMLHRWPRGLPKLSTVADLSPVYDPRDSGQARLPGTSWTVSTNPVLQLLDYLTGDRGPGLDWDEMIAPVLDDLMAEADYCDELVLKADGLYEKRYESNGWAWMTNDPADVIAMMLATCDGWMAEKGDGTLALVVGKYRAPSVTFTDDHILGFSIDHGVPDEEIINEIRFSYVPPQNHYKEAQGVAWQDTASISELGRVRAQSMNLTWVQSHPQARRLAKRAMARHVSRIRGTLQTTMFGLQALGQRWVGVQSDVISDLSDAAIEITKAKIDFANARFTFDFVLVNPNEIDAWEPEEEEGDAPGFLPEVTISVVASGSPGSQVAQVSFSDPNQNQLAWVVEYKRESPSPTDWFRETHAAYALPLITSTLSPGSWLVRVAAKAPMSSGSVVVLGNWSDLASVTIA